jgi:hypothetical protein
MPLVIHNVSMFPALIGPPNPSRIPLNRLCCSSAAICFPGCRLKTMQHGVMYGAQHKADKLNEYVKDTTNNI